MTSMATIQQIEVLAENLLTCARALGKECRDTGLSGHLATWDATTANSSPRNERPVPREATRLRQNMFATLMRLQVMLATPRQLIQQLAYQARSGSVLIVNFPLKQGPADVNIPF